MVLLYFRQVRVMIFALWNSRSYYNIRLSAVWLGRPITFRANDYSIPLPEPDEVDENETWQPYPAGILGDFAPQTSYTMTSFKEACHLCEFLIVVNDMTS